MEVLAISLTLLALLVSLHQLYLATKGAEYASREQLIALREYYEKMYGLPLALRAGQGVYSSKTREVRDLPILAPAWLHEKKEAWDAEFGGSFSA